MSDLLRGEYASFLHFRGFASIKHVVDPSRFRSAAREKGLAVSADGKVFRMVIKNDGYHDRFVEADGGVVLVYVCGNPEERRRQHLNRAGDAVTVLLDDKRADLHAIFKGTFLGIVAHRERKPDGTELLVPHSRIRIDACTHPTQPDVHFASDVGETSTAKKQRLASPEHLFFDTESAAPFDQRLIGRRHDPFPILQHAFVRTSADFKTRISAGCEYVRYPDAHARSLGNDESSSVLKVGLALLRGGADVIDVLTRLHRELARVVETGGCLFAHNVTHDLKQLERTASLVGYQWPTPLLIRTIDTVKVAPNFVPGAEDAWMRLEDLARVSGLQKPAEEQYHDAETDTRVLWRIVAAHFQVEALDAYVEVHRLA